MHQSADLLHGDYKVCSVTSRPGCHSAASRSSMQEINRISKTLCSAPATAAPVKLCISSLLCCRYTHQHLCTRPAQNSHRNPNRLLCVTSYLQCVPCPGHSNSAQPVTERWIMAKISVHMFSASRSRKYRKARFLWSQAPTPVSPSRRPPNCRKHASAMVQDATSVSPRPFRFGASLARTPPARACIHIYVPAVEIPFSGPLAGAQADSESRRWHHPSMRLYSVRTSLIRLYGGVWGAMAQSRLTTLPA